jgi:sec-independent protein translocase protein TatA
MTLATLGAPEIGLIVLAVLLLFGSTQLPKLARSLGQAQKEFKTGLKEGATDEDEDQDSKAT